MGFKSVFNPVPEVASLDILTRLFIDEDILESSTKSQELLKNRTDLQYKEGIIDDKERQRRINELNSHSLPAEMRRAEIYDTATSPLWNVPNNLLAGATIITTKVFEPISEIGVNTLEGVKGGIVAFAKAYLIVIAIIIALFIFYVYMRYRKA